ncbi:PKD domain-containing protein [Candidatus Bipolaricaulota bacterium]|nr:PKD domain-containing protein [Candidatus Bipolaricaulota bacterium]
MQAAKQTRSIAIGTALLFLWLIAGIAVAQDVLISEISWSGSSEDSTHEWIELRSLFAQEIDLAGWRLVSEDGYPNILLSGTIPPFGYYLLERATDDAIPCLSADLVYSGALRDGGETLCLYDADHQLIDIANPGGGGWPAGTDALDVTPFLSMERVLPGLAALSNPWDSYRQDLDISEPPCSMIFGTPGRENSVENAQPIATFTITPNPARPGEQVLLDAGASVDPSGEIHLYEWTVDGETICGEQTASAVFEEEGDYAITLTITDWKRTTESMTSIINVAWNCDPIADFSVGSSDGNRAFVSRDDLWFIDESTDFDGKIVSWRWNFGDGVFAEEQQVRHAYAESGTYAVTLDVADDRGSAAQTTQSLTIGNLLPVAAFAVPSCPVTEGDSALFDASSSFDLDGMTLVYRWDFDSDGEIDLIQTGSAIAEHRFAGGDYLITLQVEDDCGGLSLPASAELVVNRPPVPNFAVSCPVPTQCQEITLDATFSTDPDGILESWAWSFGNGGRASGPQVTTMYEAAGAYTIGLTVVDDTGASRTITQDIVVSDLPPEAVVVVSDAKLPTGSAFAFNACESIDPCGGQIRLYEWDLDGDGTFEVSGTSCTAQQSFRDDGRRSISLRVVDEAGNSNTTSTAVTVTNRAPQCGFTFAPEAPNDAEDALFVAEATDPDGEVASISWSFGDGTSATGESVTHGFPDNGIYTVMLFVSDDDGSVASCSQEVAVSNAPPVSLFEISPPSVGVGDRTTFNSLAYDPSPTGEIVHLAWDFGDGAVTSGRPSDSSTTNISSPSHTYDHSGTFVVSLAAIDDHGALSIASQIVTILP